MRIVKRRKGNRYYYYMQHSFRENGRVVTEEKYLGKKLPKSIEAIREKMEEAAKRRLYAKLKAIRSNFQKQWKRYPESAKERELREIAIAFTYNTNAIEGSTITLEEVREILEDKIAPNKPLRDIRETENHAKVFLEMLKSKQKMSNEILLKWHKEIFGETKRDIAGSFRYYYNVRVGPHIAPHWSLVGRMMKDLILFINRSRLNAVDLAARAHYRFENIHPFGDGNGRIGRLLMNYIMWLEGYPMLIIEYEDRGSYYKALQGGEESFVKYFMRRYISVHKKRTVA